MKLSTTSWLLTIVAGVIVGVVSLAYDDFRLIIFGTVVAFLVYIVGWCDGFLRAQSDHIRSDHR
jgi:hypothetical protein